MLQTFLFRLLATLRPAKTEQRISEEFDDHLAALTADEEARGLPPAEAQRAARRQFGPQEPAKELYRDQARFRLVENLVRDARLALRQYRKNPGFTAAAIVSLALGIGANAALFSFVDAILLKQLPVPDSQRLQVLKEAEEDLRLSYHQLNELARESTQIDGLLGTRFMDVSLLVGDHPRWISAELVTGDYFRTLQIRPERGRLLNQHDLDDAAGNPVCVISHRLWTSEFQGAANVVGRTIRLNTHPYKIVGITERGFAGPDLQKPTDIQIPITRLVDYMPAFVGMPRFDWQSRLFMLAAMVRLKPGVTPAGAAAELTRSNHTYLGSANRLDRPAAIQLAPGSAGLQSAAKLARPAIILLAVAFLVLLIACANLATLLLSRISARSKEFALRLAIGSSRQRILMQLLVESALLALFGTTAGLAVAYASGQILLSFLNRVTPQIHQLHLGIDSSVVVFVAVIAVVSVLLFGAAPALQAARTAPFGSSAGNTQPGVLLRKCFVVAQIALSFVVVLAAALLANTLAQLNAADLGYAPAEIAAIEIQPATGGYSGIQASQLYRRIVERVRSVPGVQAAASSIGGNFTNPYQMSLDGHGKAALFAVNAGYFDTFGARLLSGRDFNDADGPDKPQVYIISAHLAHRYFQGENPLGRTMRIEGRDSPPIIGVVSDIRAAGPGQTSLDTVYQHAGQLLASSLTVYARCQGPCAPLLPNLRIAIQQVDPQTPILSINTVQTEIDGAYSTQQVLAFLSTLFAALAMLLVAVGIYGVLSYTLTRRTREMGIRLALGASTGEIVSLFLSETAILVVFGALLGIPSAWAAVALLESQLFGVHPHDFTTLAVSVIAILLTATLAAIPPIRRALAIAPQQALRID